MLHRFNLIPDVVAKTILQSQIDNYVCDYSLGRTINFRLDDKSSVLNDPKLREHLYNLVERNRDDVVKEIQSGKKYYPFIVHETFSNLNIFFELYPNLKVVCMKRNPVDLAYSWYQRGFGKRWGVDLSEGSLCFQGQKQPVPWFVHESKEKYECADEMDRIIISLRDIDRMDFLAFAKLNYEWEQKTLFVSYEKLLVDPDVEIRRLSRFFGKKILPEMEIIKAQERLPNEHPKLIRESKLRFIEEMSSAEYFSALLELEKSYEQQN